MNERVFASFLLSVAHNFLGEPAARSEQATRGGLLSMLSDARGFGQIHIYPLYHLTSL